METLDKFLTPRNKAKQSKRDRILALYSVTFENIKESMKAYFRKTHGFYPFQSEGTCKVCSEKLVKEVNGDLIFGYFKTDTKFKRGLLIKRTEDGLHTIAEIKDGEPTKVTHWWVEIGNLIIDLTAEQFNDYLKPSSQKYDRIELIFKNEPKAKRYFGEERYKHGRFMEDPYEESENIDWETDEGEGEWQKRDEEERENNSISY
jgi:hypothetical protein